MNAFKPIERIDVCLECGSDDLYGPEPHFWCIACVRCGKFYELLRDDRPAGKRPRRFKRVR